MDKDPHTKNYGVLGYPAKHSLSPAMHNMAFRKLKINSVYKIFEIPPKGVKTFLKSLKKKNICGLNVTVPYKEKVIKELSALSNEAKLISAVNTIKVSGNKLLGFNTDAAGFLKHLTCDLKFNPKNKTVAIIGAGGASRAISVALSKTKARQINIYDIDKKRLSSLAGSLRKYFKKITFKQAQSICDMDIPNCDLLINATAVGMKKTDPCLVGDKLIRKGMLVYDLIYNPKETKLLKLAKEKGARAANGLGMLLYQGAKSFELWTNQPAPVKVMRRALMEAIKNA